MVLCDKEMPGVCLPKSEMHISSNDAEFVQNVYNVLERALANCKNKAQIIIGLTGGNIVYTLTEVLPSLNEDYLERIRFIFCDERRVPLDSMDSIYGQYAKIVLPRLQPTVSKDQFLCINPFLKTEDCAKEYERKIRQLVGSDNQWPEIDILLLDVGEDGHTCSLFSGHPALQEDRFWVAAVNDSPKSPAQRVTLTVPVLNNARNIVFIVNGASKSNVIKKIFESGDENKQGNQTLPASLIHPTNYGSRMHWILDKSAASLLTTPNLANN